MSSSLSKSPIQTDWLDIRRWTHALQWRWRRFQESPRRNTVNAVYEARGNVSSANAKPSVLADGMYDNPNHFFRLRLMLEAIPDVGAHRLVGVLRTSADTTALHTLKAIGFQEFVFLEETSHHIDHFRETAREKLCGTTSHADLLDIELPDGIPAYVFYDTVLKNLRHPRPPINHPAWEYYLAELLRNIAIYSYVFDQWQVEKVIFSHGWKNEYAPAVWAAVKRGIPAYHVTAYYDTMRVRLIASENDYSRPRERLEYVGFQAFSENTRSRIAAAGWQYLEDRGRGQGTDINGRRAFRPEVRQTDKRSARVALGVADDRPLGIVFAHAWYDFPHIFALSNFSDFLDWMQVTLDAIARNDNLVWYLKPHPLESWYGNFRLADIVGELPPHVRLQPEGTDSLTVTVAADVAVTVHGTIGFEAAARGVPVICADRSYYDDWPFVSTATSREHYIALIENAHRLTPPDTEKRNAAAAFAYFACAPHPPTGNLIQLKCDSSGLVLYHDIIKRLGGNCVKVDNEIVLLSEWVVSGNHSYSIYVKKKLLQNSKTDTLDAICPEESQEFPD